MLTITLSDIAISPVEGHDPAWEIKTFSFVAVNPNPVGVGQTVYVNGFLSKPPPTASMGGAGDVYEDMTIKVTFPDGTKQTWGPFYSDPTGGMWTSFVPSEMGNYTFQMFYAGQVLDGMNTHYSPGATPRAPDYWGDVMLPSQSDIVTLTVQEVPIKDVYIQPLPTEYWSRPINSQNYAWGQLGSNWYGLSTGSFMTTGGFDATGNIQPAGPAPYSAHILWTKPTGFGGQVGEPFPSDQESQYTSTSIGKQHFNSIIINGVLFYVEYPGLGFGNQTEWVAVDLHTGQELWRRDRGETGNENLRLGQAIKFHTLQEFGSYATLWTYSGSTYRIYDAFTGKGPIARITGATSASFVMDFDDTQEAGTILGYYNSGSNLIMWNSTLCLFYGSQGFQGSPAVFVSYTGDIPWANGIQWNVSRSFTINGASTGSLGIGAVTKDVILLRSAPTRAQGSTMGYQITAGIDAKTGQLLWGPLNQTIPQDEGVSMAGSGEDYYVLLNKDRLEAYGYSLKTGQQVWGPVKLSGNAWSHISSAGEIAYGKVYIWDLGGYVNAIDLETGKVAWVFQRGSSGYETPYGIYPLWVQGSESFADGMMFLCEGTSYNPPLFPGARRLAINCSNGELVWSLSSFSVRTIGAIADSMFVDWNGYDKQIYTLGKGQTATTITASPKTSAFGNSIIVEGFITDESPGTKDSNRIARFPQGVPVVGDESMTEWMEYVYMQLTKPTSVTGVPVTLSVLDSNGNYREIGTTTTVDGFYTFNWTPDIPGAYTLYATFDGSNSYWPSNAVTSFAVDPAQPTPSPIAEVTLPPTEIYFAISTIAIIAAIAVIGTLLLLAIRKRT